ncbi:MAG: hypothetical protein ACLUVC_07260 [Longibaculum sp.]
MKKIFKLVFILTLLLGGIFTYHIHNDKCGYNPETKTGCRYEISLHQEQDSGV